MSKDLYSKRLEDLFSGDASPAPDPAPPRTQSVRSPQPRTPAAQPANGLSAPAGAEAPAPINGFHTASAEVEALRARIVELETELEAVQARLKLHRSGTGPLQNEIADLRLSRELLELAVEGANEGLWDWDLASNTVTFSPTWKRLIGFTATELEDTFATFEERLHPAEREQVLATLKAYLDGQLETYTTEYRFRHKDGTYRWMLARGKALRDADGRPTRMAGSHTDITERKRAEDALRESEERYRSFIENSFDLVQSVDADGRFLFVNRAWLETLGYTPEELPRLNLFQIIHPDSLAHCQALFDRLQRGENVTDIEAAFVTKNGETVWLEGSSTPRRLNGQVVATQSIFRNITERRRTETQLRLQSAALGAAANAIVITDADGVVQWVNPAFTRLTGYRPEDIVGGKPSLLKSGQHDAAFYQKLWQTVLAGQVWQGEIVNRRKDGSLYTEEMTITPVYSTEGAFARRRTITHFIAIKQDVTERARAQQALRESEERFRALAEATLEGVIIHDDGVIVEVNEALALMFGYPREELLGRNLLDFIAPESRATVGDHIRRGSLEPYEASGLRRNGVPFPLEMIGRSLPYQGRLLHAGILRDLSVRRQTEAALARRTRELETLNRLSQALSVQQDLNAAMELVGEEVLRAFNASGGFVALYDPATEMISLPYLVDNGQRVTVPPIPLDRGPTAHIIRTRAPLVINHDLDERMAQLGAHHTPGLEAESKERSWLGVPILTDEAVVGVISVGSPEEDRFSDDDVRLLGTIAGSVAASLQKVRLFEQMRQRAFELEETTRFLDSVIENLPVMLSVKDAEDLRFVRWNKAGEEVLGYKREDLLGRSDRDLFPPEQAERFIETDRAVLASGQLADIPEESVQTASGETRLLHTRKIPVLDADGVPRYLLSLSEDLTERRRAEAELRSLFAAMTDVVLVYDAEGRYLRIMSTDASLLFRPSAEMLGKRMHDIMPAAKADELLTHLRRALLKQQTVRAEYQLTINGHDYWFDASISPLGDNTVFWVARDITERKQAESLVARRAAELEALNSLSQALNRTQDLAATLKTVGENVIRIFNAHSGYIALYDAQTEHVELPYFFEEGHAISVPPMPLSQGPTAHLIRSRRTLVINSDADRRMQGLGARTFREPSQQPRSWVGVPILSGYDVVGVLSLGSLQEGRFSDEDVHLLETIASGVAASIQKARLFDQMQKRANELATVAEVSAAAAAARDPDALLKTVVELTKARFGLYHAHVYLLNEPGDTLVLAAGAGEAGAQMLAQGWSIPLNREQSLVARAARTRQGVLINDVMQDPGFLPNPLLPETRAEMAIPMIVGDRLLGVLDVQSERVGRFTPEDVQIKTTLAAQIAIALQNARSFAETERLLQELNIVTQRLTGKGWQAYAYQAGLADQTYVYDLTHVRRAPTTSELSAAGQVQAPLTVQGTAIGQLAIAEPGLPVEDAQEIVAAVAERLSAHLENLRLTDATQAALAETEQLYDFSSRLNAAVSFEEVVRTAASVVGAHAGRLLTFELGADNRPEWTVVKAVWPGGENLAAIGERQRALDFPLARTWLGNPFEPLLIGDWERETRLSAAARATLEAYSIPQEDMNFRKTLDAAARTALPGARAAALLALMLGGKWVGLLALTWVEPQTFRERDVQRLRAVAAQVAVVVNNRLLFEKTQENLTRQERLSAELETVAQVSAAASTLLERDRLLQEVVELTRERFGLDHVHIYLSDDVSETLQLAAGAGEAGRQMVREGRLIPLLLENSIVAKAARTRQPVLVNDTQAAPGFQSHPLLLHTRSELAVPLVVGERVLGVLDVQSDRPNRFTPEDVRIKSTLAAQVAIALQNANLYAEQTATVTRLRELDQLKSSFLANMSHELRTPLNSILGFTDVILEGLDGPLTDRMENDLKVVQKNGQHLLGLINDILDMAKIEAGRMTINPQRFNLGEVIDEVMEITLPLAREKRLYLRSEIGSYSDLDLDADQVRVRQVLLNLVGNAVKFTERGGVSLRAERVLRSGESGDDHLLICVSDTGIGIPPNKLESIFEAFSQIDTSTTRKAGGTGLGLPISRHLIELHGGRLWAESSGLPGDGARFYIELPVKYRQPVVLEN